MFKADNKISMMCLSICFSTFIACGSAGYEKPDILNSPLRFTMANIDGEIINLASYKGNVVLIVNCIPSEKVGLYV